MPPPSILPKIRQWADGCQSCTGCPLHTLNKRKITHRYSIVHPGRVDVLFVGEGPGKSENACGEPFVPDAPAGETLQDLIQDSIPPTKSYLITNSVLCTPWKDNSLSDIGKPKSDQIKACSTNLRELIDRIKPRHIVALGRDAEKALKHLKLDYIYISHPSAINRAKDFNYEYSSARLTLSGIYNPVKV